MCLTWINSSVTWRSNFRKLFIHYNRKHPCLLSWWRMSQPFHTHFKGGERKKHGLKLFNYLQSKLKARDSCRYQTCLFSFFVFICTLLILMTTIVLIVGSIWHTQLNLDIQGVCRVLCFASPLVCRSSGN